MLDDMSNFLNDADMERRARRNTLDNNSNNNNNNNNDGDNTYNEEDMYSSPWA
jgi:hypothetical protein